MYIHCPPKALEKLVSETFSDGRRYYVSPGGKKLASVTTVIGAKKKAIINEWRNRVGHEEVNRISNAASKRGTRLHMLVEKHLMNEKVTLLSEMPDSAAMYASLKDQLKHINNIHYQEQSLWSEKIGMAGTVDCIAEWKGVLSVIDFKTSSKIKKEEDIQDYFAQCTAYSLMYEELIGVPVNQIVILMAVEAEKPLVFVQKTQDHIGNLAEHIDFYHKNVLTSK